MLYVINITILQIITVLLQIMQLHILLSINNAWPKNQGIELLI